MNMCVQKTECKISPKGTGSRTIGRGLFITASYSDVLVPFENGHLYDKIGGFPW